jgi:hypothetical protein
MRLPAVVATLLATLSVAGCASTVSPLYVKTDAVADPAIVGTWAGSDKNGSGTVRIEAIKDGSYQVSIHDNNSGDDAVYEAHPVKLGGASFADLILTKFHHGGQDVDLPWGAVALHEIVKYQLSGDDLAVSVIEDDLLTKSAKQSGFPLRVQDTAKNGDTVILSTTGDLRRYLTAHPADIFGESEHFKRQH